MSSDQNWVEALKISPESLSEWSLEAPSGMPLLVWGITHGHIDAHQYLAWACDHFALAVLDSRFFSESFQKENLKALREQAPWSAWCFPIGEWDDVTFVACAEPPSEMPEGHFAFVLADPVAMKDAWSTNEGTALFDGPQGLNPNLGKTFVLNLDETVLTTTPSHVAEPSPVKSVPAKSVTPPAPPKPVAPPKVAGADTPSQVGEGELKESFERLHESYQSVMIMRCVDGVAKPFKWDPDLAIGAGEEKFNVNLNYPSFLRIVAKTMQPYHGYVIDSPAHREFFENMNFNDLPPCVTGIPLKQGEKLWGILICLGGQSALLPEALNEALTVSEKIATILGLSQNKVAAA